MIGINGCRGPMYCRLTEPGAGECDMEHGASPGAAFVLLSSSVAFQVPVCCKENLKFDILLSKNNSKRHTFPPTAPS